MMAAGIATTAIESRDLILQLEHIFQGASRRSPGDDSTSSLSYVWVKGWPRSNVWFGARRLKPGALLVGRQSGSRGRCCHRRCSRMIVFWS